jgi:glutamyl-tRNA reductase
MSILVYGLNHRSAPLEVRERLVFPPEELAEAVTRLVRTAAIEEGLILSTCNRTEILASARAAGAGEGLKRFLAGERRVTAEELERHCYLHSEKEAVRHVFRVASSLDSMIVGEAQILGQVKEAYAAALKAGGLGTILEALMQRSFAVAKKVRSETGVARYPVSIAYAAAALARDIFGDLKDSGILIVGAGKMAHLTARHLIREGVRSVSVANRSYQRAVEVAQDLGGGPVPFDRLFEEMERCDIVIASTAAPHPVIGHEDALRVSRARRGRPLFFIDIAVPRDVDPRVNEIGNVYLYDLDDLQGVVRSNLDERRQEAQLAEVIVDRETAAYLDWLSGLQVTPTIVDLRRHLHAVGAGEVARFLHRLRPLTTEQQRGIEELASSLVNKILHQPILALKRATARGGSAERMELIKEIFGLDGSRGAPAEGRTAEDPAGGTTPAEPLSRPERGDR